MEGRRRGGIASGESGGEACVSICVRHEVNFAQGHFCQNRPTLLEMSKIVYISIPSTLPILRFASPNVMCKAYKAWKVSTKFVTSSLTPM